MNSDKSLIYRLLQMFIISFPFVALGINIGNNTMQMSFVVLFILTMLILIKKQTISIDKISGVLIIFFGIAIFSTCLMQIRFGGRQILVMSDVMYAKNLKQLIMFFIMIIHFIILRVVLKKYDNSIINSLIWFFIIVSLIVSLYSIYQFLGIHFSWPFIDILRTSRSYPATDITKPHGWLILPRATAFMPEPSFWGNYLLIPTSLILPFVFRTKSIKLSFLFLIFLIAQFLSFSRTGWAGLLCILIYFIFSKTNYKAKITRIIKFSFIIGTVSAVILFMYIPDKAFFIQRLIKLKDDSTSFRFQTQAVCFKVFLKYPITGIGWGNTPSAIYGDAPYSASSEGLTAGTPETGTWKVRHITTYNWYLQLLLETGVMGFFVFMFFLYQLWNRLKIVEKKARLSSKDENMQDIILGLKLSFIAILLSWLNLAAYNFSYTWFILALIAVLPDIYKNTESLKNNL